MEKIKDYCIDKGIEFGGEIVSYLIEKLWGYTQEKLPKIKYKTILDKSSEIGEKFLYFFDSSIKEKADNKNNIEFKQFDNKIIKEIINQIIQKENIEKDFDAKVKEDINNINKEYNNLNILLIDNQKIYMEQLLKMISIYYKIDKINYNEFSFNIELKDNFKELRKINLIKYKDENSLNKEINCIWYFTQSENINIENEFLEKFPEKNIPIIFIYQKEKINKDKLISYPEKVKIEDEIIHQSFDSIVIDFNEKNNKDNDIICLIEKSLYNILIKKYEIMITNESKEAFEKVRKNIKFQSGNKIDNINILIGQFLKKIFSILIFNGKNISDFAKQKSNELMNKYKEHLKLYEEKYLNDFVKKIGDNYINKIKDGISKRNTLSNKANMLTNDQMESLEILDEIEHSSIDFIDQIDLNKKEEPKNDKINENDFNTKIKIKFNDYYIEKAAIHIIQLVTIIIKETFIKYYKLCIIMWHIGVHKNEEILLKQIKED